MPIATWEEQCKPEEKRWFPTRTLNDEEQAEQVEGALGDWPLCQRCNLRFQPWINAGGRFATKHYLCPGSDRKLVIRAFNPRGTYSHHDTSRPAPSFTGTVEGTRVLEIYPKGNGRHSYVYMTTLDGSVPFRYCKRTFTTRKLALEHAIEFLSKNIRWKQEKEPEHESEDLAELSRRRSSYVSR